MSGRSAEGLVVLVERGFPLQLHSLEGDTAETLTLVPVLDAFPEAHPEVVVSVA